MPNYRRWMPLLIALSVSMAACSSADRPPVGAPQFATDLQQMADTVAASAGYPKEAIELIASRVRLQVSIADANLASLDDAARTARVAAVVASLEELLPNYPELGGLQTISVAVIHPSQPDASPKEWHTEDVFEYRRGPSQRFTIHVS